MASVGTQLQEITRAAAFLRLALRHSSDDAPIDEVFALLADVKRSSKDLASRFAHLKSMRDDASYRVMYNYRLEHPDEKGYVLIMYSENIEQYILVDRDPVDIDLSLRHPPPPMGHHYLTFWAGDQNDAPGDFVSKSYRGRRTVG